MLVQPCAPFKGLPQALPLTITIMSILRAISQVRREALRNQEGQEIVGSTLTRDQVFSLACVLTFTLQGMCYDLKKNSMLLPGSVEPDGGSF